MTAALLRGPQYGPCLAGQCCGHTGNETELLCDVCEGGGCGECGQQGYVKIVGCPVAKVSSASREAVRLYRYFERGFLPNSGGILDQSVKFHQAMDLLSELLITGDTNA